MQNKIYEILKRHEGLRLKPYKDTVGILTIGVGRNLEDRGISEDEATIMLQNDINRWVLPSLRSIFPFFESLSENRQLALISMMFNLGETRFKAFLNTIVAIRAADWEKAASEVLKSKWANQVGQRAKEISEMLKNG